MKNKVTKDSIPNDFTIGLALFDSLPVLFFAGTMVLLCIKFKSILFLIGSLLVLFAGISKVLWKIIVVLKKKNIWFLFVQMRITMPIGFILIIASLFVNKDSIDFLKTVTELKSFPAIIFFISTQAENPLIFSQWDECQEN